MEMMREALERKVIAMEQLMKEEEEKARQEEEAEKLRLEAEQKAKKEAEEQMIIMKIRVAEMQQYQNKKRYLGGKIEPRTEYYNLLMRKRESTMIQKVQ